MDAPISEDDGDDIGSFVEDTEAETGLVVVERQETHDELETMLQQLPPRTQYVLRRRFGFDERKEDKGKTPSLEQVGLELGGIKRQRVQQIERRGIQILRIIQAGGTYPAPGRRKKDEEDE